jgi:hypothetical protein
MAKTFAITTTATDTLKADAKGHAEAVFTVTNASARPVRGMARAKALAGTKRDWLTIAGETERDFGGGSTEQFIVYFDAADAPAGKYPFRLDIASALNPDEDFTEGSTVNVEVAAVVTPTPPKKFPLWIILAIVGALLLIGIVILIIVLAGRKGSNEAEATPTPTETASPNATRESPSPTPPATNEFRVIGTTLIATPDNFVGPCPARITFSGSITANKAGKVKYTFLRSDGAIDTIDHSLDFTGPGSKTVETTWTLGAAIPIFQPFRGFQQIKILSPNEMESDRANFVLHCQ